MRHFLCCFFIILFPLMKKIFRTTMFRFILIFFFRSYLRLFDHQLGSRIGWRFSSSQQCLTGIQGTGIAQQLDDIQTEISLLSQKIESGTQAVATASVASFKTTTATKVALYYFNSIADQKLPAQQQANISSVLPVYRIFPATENILIAALNELLQWRLTVAERNQWFTTEFPHADFRLLSAELAADGTLTLWFPEILWFTDGGSARMAILQNSIKKTASQFSGVRAVTFTPATLFQP